MHTDRNPPRSCPDGHPWARTSPNVVQLGQGERKVGADLSRFITHGFLQLEQMPVPS
ncbi:hypothetical protein DFJ75_3931 [Williamsia muralis]|uniref:Uncharacterized protein n=1 Tax=Williamsia marianensis TaxID=85044 RepID=A0A495K6Y9_WILMA|nr:hypothetical protein DFJ75_3931 [Williamsia muralis]